MLNCRQYIYNRECNRLNCTGLVGTLLFLLCLCTVCLGNDSYVIRNDYPIGKYLLTQESNKTIVLSYQNVSRMMKSQFRISWNVDIEKGDSDAQRVLSMNVIRLTITEDSGDPTTKTFFFDSDDRFSMKNKIQAIYNIFLKQKFVIYLNKEKGLEKVDGIETMWKEMEALDDPDSKQYIANLKAIVTESTFAETFTQLNYVLPSKPVNSGEKWESQSSLDFPVVGKINLLWDNTLVSVVPIEENKIARVESKAVTKLVNNSIQLEFNVSSLYNVTTGMNQEFNSETKIQSDQTKNSGTQQTNGIKQTGVIRSKQILKQR